MAQGQQKKVSVEIFECVLYIASFSGHSEAKLENFILY